MTPRVAAAPVSGVMSELMTKTISSAHWLVVAMIARFRPPVSSGTSMASESRPSSGSWYMNELSVPMLRKFGTRSGEEDEQRREERDEPGVAGAEAGEEAAEAGAVAGRRGSQPWAGASSRVRWRRPRRELRTVIEVETRMVTPMTIWKK